MALVAWSDGRSGRLRFLLRVNQPGAPKAWHSLAVLNFLVVLAACAAPPALKPPMAVADTPAGDAYPFGDDLASGVGPKFDAHMPDIEPEDTDSSTVDLECRGNAAICAAMVPPEMVWIREGYFWMGCVAEFCLTHGEENPVHLVWLDGYAMDLFETTVEDYAQCVAAGACSVPYAKWSPAVNDNDYNWGAPDGRSQHPINGVSRLQKVAYCQWRGKRLPTEAEWEKAARGGCESDDTAACLKEARNYPWGNEAPTCARVVANTQQLQPDGNPGCGGPLGTRPVGSKPAGRSPYGLWDMAGNVSESVTDWYSLDYYSVSPPINPKGPAAGDWESKRVGRGYYFGAGFEFSWKFSVSNRQIDLNPVEMAGSHSGVRCAK